VPPIVMVAGVALAAVNVAWLECKFRTIPLPEVPLVDVVTVVVVPLPVGPPVVPLFVFMEAVFRL
jgi:hypothetical protein